MLDDTSSYSFEDPEPPANWQACGGGSLQVSPRHRRDGEQSLAWTWENGSSLECRGVGLDLRAQPGAGIKAWIYLERPIDGELTFVFGTTEEVEAGKPAYAFPFKLNFTGWRTCWVALREDAANPDHNGEPGRVEIMRIHPPKTVPAGTVFLDAVEFVPTVGQRSPDWQLPFLPAGDDPFTANQPMLHAAEEPRRPLPNSVTGPDREALATIRGRYEKWLLGTAAGNLDDLPADAVEETKAFIQQGWEGYRELSVRADADGWLTGPALGLRRTKWSFFDLFNILLPLAFDYTLTGSEEARGAALQLFDYASDQGWAEGSSRGNMFLNVLVFAAYCHALYLMRDELERTGRLDTHLRAAHWYLCFGKAFRAFDTPEQETNTDELRSIVFTALPVLLAMPESPRQLQYLQSWRDWLQNGLHICPKFAGMIKPDGCGWHHRGVYTVCYTGEAYELASVAAYFVHDTPYALEEWPLDNLAYALRAEFDMSFNRQTPFALRGRMPGGKYDPDSAGWYAMCAAFGFLAMAAPKQAPTMGAIFARLWDSSSPAHEAAMRLNLFMHFPCKETVGRRRLLEEFAAQAPAPTALTPRFLVKPWAGLALAHGNTFLAAVKGYGQYVWNFECHPKAWSANEENVFARFVSNGHLQILAEHAPDTPTTLGYNLTTGWDWARWPGATNKRLTLDEIYSPDETWQTRWFSDETFVGGVETGRDEGAFAVNLHDTCYDHSFRARKTYFVFGNEIICLGSGITCNDPEHAVETTLFQAYLPTPDRPMVLNGEAITALPFAQTVRQSGTVTLHDPYGNGYVVPPGQSVHLARQRQKSRTHNNRGPTEGDYAVACFDHGFAPKDQAYEYAVLVQSTPEKLERFARQPPYHVLQCDAAAHIVDYPGRRAAAAAIFAVETEIPAGPVARTDTPVMVFARTRESGDLELAVAVPDLKLPRRENMGFVSGEDAHVTARPTTVSLLLRGSWITDDPGQTAAFNDTLTALTVKCRDGASVRLVLKIKEPGQGY